MTDGRMLHQVTQAWNKRSAREGKGANIYMRTTGRTVLAACLKIAPRGRNPQYPQSKVGSTRKQLRSNQGTPSRAEPCHQLSGLGRASSGPPRGQPWHLPLRAGPEDTCSRCPVGRSCPRLPPPQGGCRGCSSTPRTQPLQAALRCEPCSVGFRSLCLSHQCSLPPLRSPGAAASVANCSTAPGTRTAESTHPASRQKPGEPRSHQETKGVSEINRWARKAKGADAVPRPGLRAARQQELDRIGPETSKLLLVPATWTHLWPSLGEPAGPALL